MIKYILKEDEHSYTWIDITDPTAEDFNQLKDKYKLNETSIRDCIEIGHLPKIEEFQDYHFLIIRSVSSQFEEDSDTLTEITERISIFYNEHFLITVHRNNIDILAKLINGDYASKKYQSTKNIVNNLLTEALKTFQNLVLGDLSVKLDAYEEAVFLHQHRKKPFLKKLYYIKRQIDVIRSVLIHYKDIIDYFHMPEYKNLYTQHLKDMFSRTTTLYRNIAENTSQLLSIYFNIESNHTNEIMRTLTIISVFFMPLTFIVGIYGMNFKIMPELEWTYGYPIIMGSMLLLSLLIYIWFKRKHWL